MKKIYLGGMLASLLMGCVSGGENLQKKTTATTPVIDFNANTIALIAKLDPSKAPSQNFDLTKWKINIPMEDDKPARAGKVMEISDTLCLSPKTVNSYRYRLFDKLNVEGDVELTHMAIRYGLIETQKL